jgi:hypothetical protein
LKEGADNVGAHRCGIVENVGDLVVYAGHEERLA